MQDRCEHPRVEVRVRTYSNGTKHLAEQCLTCGSEVRKLPKQRWVDFRPPLPKWDDSLANAFWEKQRQFWAQKCEREKAERDAAWWARYDAYMDSPEWADIRRRALERDNWLCQGCRRRKAIQVHHLTYARLGAEMLFDLVSVCVECHEAIHAPRSES